MKLRIQGNSVRLRLTKSEVTQIGEKGRVEETVEFGLEPSQKLIYALETTAILENLRATFEDNCLRVFVPGNQAEQWANSNRVGIEFEQPLRNDKFLRILIEKDFACLDERLGEDQSDAFPHPLEGKAC